MADLPRGVIWARLALAATGLGALLLVVAVAATRRLWFSGYISEAGVSSSGHAGLYRAGILALSAGQLLLAGAVLVRARLAWVAVLLAAAGGFGALSASVSCSAGCPLPPHETPTAMDLVHAGASILAIGAIALTILLLALMSGVPAPWPPRLTRLGARVGPAPAAGTGGSDPGRVSLRLIRVSRVAALTVVPLVVLSGLAILIVGRGAVTGLLERAVLIGATGWTLALGRRLASYAP